jgi:hypothetical protein
MYAAGVVTAVSADGSISFAASLTLFCYVY